MKAFPREVSSDRQLNALQDNAASATRTARFSPFGDGVLLQNLSLLANQPLNVNTTLGRLYRGWIVTRLQHAGAFVQALSEDPSKASTTNLTLISGSTCTADVWVF